MTPPVDNRPSKASLVLPRNKPDPSIRARVRSYNVRRSICTAVVDYNDLVQKRKWLEGTLNLSENSFDVSGLVQCWHNQSKLPVLNILRAQLERSFFVSSHVGLNVGSGGESGHYESRQRGRIDGYRALPLVGNEAQFSEPMHKKTDSGSGCANHFRQLFLMDLWNDLLRFACTLRDYSELHRARQDIEDSISPLALFKKRICFPGAYTIVLPTPGFERKVLMWNRGCL